MKQKPPKQLGFIVGTVTALVGNALTGVSALTDIDAARQSRKYQINNALMQSQNALLTAEQRREAAIELEKLTILNSQEEQKLIKKISIITTIVIIALLCVFVLIRGE